MEHTNTASQEATGDEGLEDRLWLMTASSDVLCPCETSYYLLKQPQCVCVGGAGTSAYHITLMNSDPIADDVGK